MSKMTRDEYYDLLIKTSEEGGFPARGAGGYGCYYLAPDGRKCVIGLLLPDGHEMQRCGCGARTLADDFQDEFWKHMPDSMSIEELCAIQNAHDGFKPWNHDAWVNQLASIRGHYANAN